MKFSLKVTLILLCGLLTIALLGFLNCSKLDDITMPTELKQGITGYVTVGLGGEVSPSSKVTARKVINNSQEEVVKTCMTDSAGYYTLPLDPGTYDVVVEKDGFSGSRFQGVSVKDNQITRVNIVQPVAQRTGYSVNAPRINVSGVETGQSVSGTMRITAIGVSDLPIEGLYWTRYNGIWLSIGNSTRMWDAASRNEKLVYDWDTTLAPPGKTVLHFITMDVNLNRCELILEVNTGYDGTIATPGLITSDAHAVAYTFNGNRCLYTSRKEAIFNRLGVNKDPYTSVVGGKSYDLKAVPPNTRINISVSWEKVADTNGYNIYRSPTNDIYANPSGYEFIGSTVGADYCNYPDYSADLSIDNLYSYQIRPYNRGGEGAPFTTCPVRILPQYSLYLISPGSDALSDDPNENPNLVVKNAEPLVFHWNVSNLIPGATRRDQIYCFNVNVSFLSLPWGLLDDVTFTDQTYAYYTGYQPILDCQTYEWDIFDSVYSYTTPATYTIYGPESTEPQTISCGDPSLSYPQMSMTTFGYSSNNGAYYFYTNLTN